MSEERRNRFRQLGRRAGLSDRALDAVDHGVDRIRDHWFGKSEDERSNTEPLVGVDRIAEFAWATVQVLRGQAGGSASVDEILELVAKELEIPPNAPERQQDPSKAESPYMYGMRRARLALIHQAKAIHNQPASQYPRLTPLGRKISQSTVKEKVEKNEKKLLSWQGNDPAQQQKDVPVRRSGEELYDRIAKCAWATIEVLRETNGGRASASKVNEEVAEKLFIKEADLRRHPPTRESNHEYEMRYARNGLEKHSGTIEVSGPKNDRDISYLPIMQIELTDRGKIVEQDTLSQDIKENARSRRRPIGKQGHSQEWQYKEKDWAWATLQAIRSLSNGTSEEWHINNAISSELAEELGLSRAARETVWHAWNDHMLEYKARCATMRAILGALNLIERGQTGKWRLLEKGAEITESELRESLDHFDYDSLGKAGNNSYRGNPELEQINCKEKSLVLVPARDERNEQAADAPVKSDSNADVSRSSHDRKTPTQPTEFRLENQQLCSEVLMSLSTEDSDSLTKKQIEDSVLERLSLKGLVMPSSYKLSDTSPPWGAKPEKRSLFQYRLEHALRAMSSGRFALIREEGFITPKERDKWTRTTYGREHTTVDADSVWENLYPYFEVHSYEDWEKDAERWGHLAPGAGRDRTDSGLMQLKDIMLKRRRKDKDGNPGNPDGTPFEHLVRDLLIKEHGLADKAVTIASGYLDRTGIDLVVEQEQQGEWTAGPGKVDMAGFQTGEPRLMIPAIYLAQVKQYWSSDVETGVPSKVFAFAARMRNAGLRGDYIQNSDGNVMEARYILGARLIILGDLSRDAEWEFWTTKEAWELADTETKMTRGESTTEYPPLQWDFWDGATVLRKMVEHGIGVKEEADGWYSPDREYLYNLPGEDGEPYSGK